ncbi:hypothetical protein HF1_07810 [Mycoplasma haemofelis str. Langford 1]|uniref:Uncharacterized protein n=1 Tax=Mycoplasma haemofelis (strain Langford 1) TaxID=941640 RepID=E8ZI18_MYCHL|nr:hypothetical protein [Mycoplasma haemofelis]CBY92789.1 hypothetical protein HF1_07810 [Mycoplasma haemofelis str. Langford 1]
MGKSLLLGSSVAAGLGVGGTALASMHLLKEKTETMRDKYPLAILDPQKAEHADLWNKKFAKLKGLTTSPKYQPLAEVYSIKENETEAKGKHKQACQKAYDSPSKEVDHLEEFKKLCFINNGDRLDQGKTLISQKTDFGTVYSAFAARSKDTLSSGFAAAWDQKGSSSTDPWQQAMLTECNKASEEIFVGDNSDFKQFCSK